MNWENIASILRHVLTFGGGIVVAKGWLSDGTVQSIIGAIIAVGGAVWGQFNKSSNSLVSMAAGVPGTVIVTTPAIAAAVANLDAKSSANTAVVTK